MTTHVVVPVRDQLSLTASLCEQMADQPGWYRCHIFDNGSEDGTWEYLQRLHERDQRFSAISACGAAIYEMWDFGTAHARKHGADHVAILNNDLILAPETFTFLSKALDAHPLNMLAYPDYDLDATETPTELALRDTHGTFRHGGMAGFAFMLHAHRVAWSPLIDPRFGWWCGDDDLAFHVEENGGRQVRVEGLGITHLCEATAKDYPELHEQKARDLALCVEKWGR